jgi:hypothetical protein
MHFFRTVGTRLETVGQLFSFFIRNKRWWMVPMICGILLLAVAIVLAQSPALGSFIYYFF